MSTTTDRLMKNLTVRLPGALTSAILLELFNAADEFCKGSNVWRADIPVLLAANVTSYQITPPDGGINRLMWALDANARPVPATMSEPGTLVLNTPPSQVSTITATVGLYPIDPVTSTGFVYIPDWIYEKYWTDFLDGVVGKMMAQPAKPYSNQQLAVYHGRRWRQAISKARIEAQRNNVYRAQSWAFPQQFARVTRPRR